MKKYILGVLSVILALSMAGVSFADQSPRTDLDPDEPEEVASAFQQEFACTLSQPVIVKEKGYVKYTTTLTVKDMQEFYGYQIQVASPNQDAHILQNKIGGVETPSVYKDETANFAALLGQAASGDIEVCEIVCQYPYSDKNKQRQLVVEKLQVVTSIAAERVLTLGPNPPALVLALPYVAPPFYATVWFYLLLAAVAAAAGGYLYYRKRTAAAKLTQ